MQALSSGTNRQGLVSATARASGSDGPVSGAGAGGRLMTYRRKLQLMGLALAVLAVGYAKTALSYGVAVTGGTVEPGVLPLLLGGLLLALSVLLVFTRNPQPDAAAGAQDSTQRRREFAESARFLGALIAYVALVTLIGFLIATLVGVSGILRFVFNYSYRRSLLYGVGMTVICYLLFTVVLRVQLP